MDPRKPEESDDTASEGVFVSGSPFDGAHTQDRSEREKEEEAKKRGPGDDLRHLDELKRLFRENAERFGDQTITHNLRDGSTLRESAKDFHCDKRPTDAQLEFIVNNALRKGWIALYASKDDGTYSVETARRLNALVEAKGLSDKIAVSMDGRPVEPPVIGRIKAQMQAAKPSGPEPAPA